MSKFETPIDATGPNGNIFAIIGAARALMRQIGVPKSEVDDMTSRAMSAQSYDDARAVIREWFPINTDDSY